MKINSHHKWTYVGSMIITEKIHITASFESSSMQKKVVRQVQDPW